jgi:thiamine biosynthesis protein ThiS
MTSLTINGRPRQFTPEAMPKTLADLLAELDVAAATVVAEVDGAIVPAEQFTVTELRPGQTIELVKFMGGG